MTDYIPQTPPIWQTSLAFDLNPNDTTATIANELLINGNQLSGLVCLSVDIGQPNPEYIIGTLSGTTLTITLRNIDPLNPNVSIGIFGSIHGQGAVVKITDFASIQMMVRLLNGDDGFQNIISYASPLTPVNPQDIVDKAYVDDAMTAGAPDASTTAKGVSRISASPNVTLGNPTITIASPAVITLASHGLTVNDEVQFTTTGALPTGLSVGVTYFVISAGLTTNAFELSLTAGGAAINTSGTQSGTHTLIKVTPVSVGVNDTRLPTAGEAAALVGNNTDIAVGSGNKFVTQTGLEHNAEKYAVDTGTADVYAIALSPIPTSLTDGMVVYAKIVHANATTTPTLNVNSLGAKTIVKLNNIALAVGDIGANMKCTLMYDLTNTQWVLQNPGTVATAPTSTAGTSACPTSSSTQTITHGLGRIPIIIRINGKGFGNGNTSSTYASDSVGTFNASGNTCLFRNGSTPGGSGVDTSSSFAIYVDNGGSVNGSGTGVIGNVTSTTFNIVWTLPGVSIASNSYIWEAQ